MATLKDIQPALRNLIIAVTLFSSAENQARVIAEDGTKNEEQEDALKGVGWCVVVSPPLNGDAVDQSPSLGLQSVLSVVTIRTNPKKNTGGTALNPWDALEAIVKAVLADAGGNAKNRFTQPDKGAWQLDPEDAGNLTYNLNFLKRLPIS